LSHGRGAWRGRWTTSDIIYHLTRHRRRRARPHPHRPPFSSVPTTVVHAVPPLSYTLHVSSTSSSTPSSAMFASPYGTPRAKRRAAAPGTTPSRLTPGLARSTRRSPSLATSTSGHLVPPSPSVGRSRYTASERDQSPAFPREDLAARRATSTGAVFLQDETSRVMSFGDLPVDVQRDLTDDEDRESGNARMIELK
jgi:hypothetical protein